MRKSMKKWLMVSWVVIPLMPYLATGATSSATRAQTETSAAIPTTGGNDSGVFLSVGPGLALLSGDTGWSLNVGALTQVAQDSPIFVGGDVGVDVWSHSSVNSPAASTGATGLQLLPTAIYRFDVSSAKNIYPYAGISVGPHIFFQNNATSAYFEFLFRPGIFLRITDTIALNVEPKFGLLKDMFIFLPNVSGVFRL
jgi:hypothetical protein